MLGYFGIIACRILVIDLRDCHWFYLYFPLVVRSKYPSFLERRLCNSLCGDVFLSLSLYLSITTTMTTKATMEEEVAKVEFRGGGEERRRRAAAAMAAVNARRGEPATEEERRRQQQQLAERCVDATEKVRREARARACAPSRPSGEALWEVTERIRGGLSAAAVDAVYDDIDRLDPDTLFLGIGDGDAISSDEEGVKAVEAAEAVEAVEAVEAAKAVEAVEAGAGAVRPKEMTEEEKARDALRRKKKNARRLKSRVNKNFRLGEEARQRERQEAAVAPVGEEEVQEAAVAPGEEEERERKEQEEARRRAAAVEERRVDLAWEHGKNERERVERERQLMMSLEAERRWVQMHPEKVAEERERDEKIEYGRWLSGETKKAEKVVWENKKAAVDMDLLWRDKRAGSSLYEGRTNDEWAEEKDKEEYFYWGKEEEPENAAWVKGFKIPKEEREKMRFYERLARTGEIRAPKTKEELLEVVASWKKEKMQDQLQLCESWRGRGNEETKIPGFVALKHQQVLNRQTLRKMWRDAGEVGEELNVMVEKALDEAGIRRYAEMSHWALQQLSATAKMNGEAGVGVLSRTDRRRNRQLINQTRTWRDEDDVEASAYYVGATERSRQATADADAEELRKALLREDARKKEEIRARVQRGESTMYELKTQENFLREKEGY